MKNEVCWLLELEIQNGREDDFNALMGEMIESTSGEAGTLNYEWSSDEQGKQVHIYERYASSTAAVTHLKTFGEKYIGRFLEVFQPTRLVVYGAPDAMLQEALSAFGPEYMRSVGGFSR